MEDEGLVLVWYGVVWCGMLRSNHVRSRFRSRST
jgi:hypothetical protein